MRTLLLLAPFALFAGATATPTASAQSAYDCVPQPDELAFPSDPSPDPYPYRQAEPTDANERRATKERHVRRTAAERLQPSGDARHRLGAADVSRGGTVACPTAERSRYWFEGGWADNYGVLAVYDLPDRPVSITEGYPGIGGEIEYDSRSVFSYDAQGRLAERVEEYANDGPLAPGYRDQYVYDGQSRLSVLVYEDWDGSSWQGDARFTLAYSSGPYTTGYLGEEWDGAAWVTNSRATFTYDGLLLTEEPLRKLERDGLGRHRPGREPVRCSRSPPQPDL